MRRILVSWVAAMAGTMVLVTAGCGGSGDDYDSPIVNEDVPVADIADLPDVDQTRAQMLDLIEQVRAEVVRLVPATDPWTWNREESTAGCTQDSTGAKGVAVYFPNLVSEHPFSDAEWAQVYPAVQRLAADAGLTGGSEMQNSTGNHDVRFHSDDGRTLTFGSQAASVISATIACRRDVP
ncbi:MULTISPECIES: LppA family lipoprotein [Mycobacteriaceae]|uniref:LppA family lipoprotein n=1 Tax=Mycobacteriaceae TaxID=1762 RepID=UPI0009EDEADE|nr:MULTISPECIES: LppA family lipoprotein [Mycobacteriaceae]MCK0176265.1 LppA family lipoprotein [Mycolicibacterium sp. F2034L]